MRRLTVRLLLSLTVLVTAALACVLPGGSPTPAPNPALTAAAETLSALATAMAATATPAPELTPSLTPTVEAPPVDPTPTVVRILYKDTGQNLWSWSEGSAPLQLTTSGDVQSAVMSPDGSLAAFTRSADYPSYSLWVLSTGGGGERQLLDSTALNSMGLVDGAVAAGIRQLLWVPGARALLVSTYPTFEGLGLMLNEDLYRIDVDSGAVTQIFERGAGGVYAVSPDGTRMTISRTDHVDLANLDGSGRLVGLVSYTPVLTYSEYAFYAEPVWAPDSSRAVVAIPPSASADVNGPTQLWQIGADGTTSTLRSFETAPLMWPVLSPDLAQVAYLTPGDPFDLNLVQSSGDLGGLSIPSVRGFLNWAHDSVRFAYTDNASGAAYIAGIAGTPAALPGAVDILDLEWLPDGRIVYLASTGGGWELRITAPTVAGAAIAILPSGDVLPSFDLP